MRALITGITGMDGSYLAELLLERGYEVFGLVRWAADIHRPNLEGIRDRITTLYGDLADFARVQQVIREVGPHEVYNLGAQAHVRVSFEQPLLTAQVDAVGALNVMEAIRQFGGHIKLYQASTSEMFGDSPPPQSESSRFNPRSPYACAKLHAHQMLDVYRKAYGRFFCAGILFNHESPRRGKHYVTRKITSGIADIVSGTRDTIRLGALTPLRDWGYAPEYVQAMWLMLQQAEPRDFVIATGKTHSVGEWIEVAFAHVGLDWRKHIVHDSAYERPLDVYQLRGDASRARAELGWTAKTSFTELVKLMVNADLVASGSGRADTADGAGRTARSSVSPSAGSSAAALPSTG